MPKRKNTVQDLIAKYKLLAQFMERIPDVIYFKDRHGRLTMVNQAHAKGLGLKPDQVVGKTDFDIFPRERAQKMAEDDAYVMKTGKSIIDKIERATRPDGVDNYVSTTKIPRYDANGRIIGLMGITRDITPRMQRELLKEERERTEKKLAALKEINKVKSEFVSVVSHELRTPLSIIKEALLLTLDKTAGPINKKQSTLLSKAKENVERLTHIIADLLDISRIEKGTMKLNYALVDLNDLIRDSAPFFKKWAEEKNIRLNYELPAQEINIFIDAEKILQIISNLTNNAIKYTEENGKIRIEVKTLDTKVRFGVIDSGIGIARQDLPKLFHRFVQLNKTAAAARKGLGLGLAIAKELIEKQGGEIWAESKLGIGSKFYFTLPRIYTTKVLDKKVKEEINRHLAKDIPLYLVDLSIINYEEFSKRVILKSKKLFRDLREIDKAIIKHFSEAGKEKPRIIFTDEESGLMSIIFPEATERRINKFCALIKAKIKDYFKHNRIKDVFINIGIASYPQKDTPLTTQQILSNLFYKVIYIGSEVRRSKRINYRANIEILFPGRKKEAFSTLDISEGGICFLSQTALDTDTRISIGLDVPQSRKRLYLKAKVAWIKILEESGKDKDQAKQYKIGVQFLPLKETMRKKLFRLIKLISG